VIKSENETVVDVKIADHLKNQSPLAIMPNSGNHGYMRVILDDHSLAYFSSNLMQVNAFDRQYLYRVLWDHVRMQRVGGN